MPSEQYHVRIAKESMVFSAAHFITFGGDVCERLHGHNYGVAVEVSGPLDENHYVIDFIAVRDALAEIVALLDHYVLLPTNHPLIEVRDEGDSVRATFRERTWQFPRGDCVLLPVANTTAELLAHWIGERLAEKLVRAAAQPPVRLRVEVDECRGQIGVCEFTDF